MLKICIFTAKKNTLNSDSCALAEGQTDVLLYPLSEFNVAEVILPRRTIQQEQHGSAGEMVQ
ncbi:hypothetical protein OESDEN_13748 [Oesophagostomum dentatum]|uniref:Uncharacterized protein n=1 Tax=Oesophagostomum dentatum TaxID=61180 RepID=A0A0B1SMD5_OESDE|nr:hypothetical protein OESDEN_13748 [Oesophagostomum dentatum]